MRCSVLLIILRASAAFCQFVEWSFPAPSDHITGLACDYGTVYALDSLDCMVYAVHYSTGALQGTLQLPAFEKKAVGLALLEDTLYFAESGTAIVHAMTTDGEPAGVWDFSGSDISSISGLDALAWGDPRLYFIDSATSIIYSIDLPLSTNVPVERIALLNCPEVHDISAPRYGDYYYPVACNDPVSPVRMYSGPDEYEVLGYGSYAGAVGVAAASEDSRFYFSDPALGAIHRYCMDMGAVGEGTMIPLFTALRVAPNPSTGAVDIVFTLADGERVSVEVFDTAGRAVFTEEGEFSAGTCTAIVDGLPSGAYHLRLSGTGWSETADFSVLR